MTTKELITNLLECDLNAEVRIYVEADAETLQNYNDYGEGLASFLRISTVERTDQAGTIIATYRIEF